MYDITITHVQGEKGLLSIRNEWEQLVLKLDNPGYFHLFQFYQSYMKAFSEDDTQFYFFLFYDNKNHLIAIFPLEKKTIKCFGFSISALAVPWNFVTSLSDVLIAKYDVSILELLFGYLKKLNITGHVIVSKSALENSCLNKLLSIKETVPFIRIPYDQNDYLTKELLDNARIKSQKKNRSTFRKIKKLEKLGKLEFQTADTPDEVNAHFKEFLHVEASGWKGKAHTAIKCEHETHEYFTQLLNNLSSTNAAKLFALKLNGQMIAAMLCVIVKATCFYIRIGYDEQYAEMSPGVILMEKVFSRLSKEDIITEFNFVTHYDYYQQWSPQSNNTYENYIFNKTLLGQIGRFWFSSKKLIYAIINWNSF